MKDSGQPSYYEGASDTANKHKPPQRMVRKNASLQIFLSSSLSLFSSLLTLMRVDRKQRSVTSYTEERGYFWDDRGQSAAFVSEQKCYGQKCMHEQAAFPPPLFVCVVVHIALWTYSKDLMQEPLH